MTMTTTAILHVALEMWGFVFCMVAAIAIWLGRHKGSRADRIIVVMEITVSLLLAMDALAWTFRGYPGNFGAAMVRISNMFVFLTSYAILAEFTTYQTCVVKEDTDFPIRIWSHAIYCVCAVGGMLVIVSQFTDFLYYFDENNLYHRTDNYYISQVIAIVGMILATYMMFYHRKYFSTEMLLSMLAYMVLPLAAAFVQIFVYGVSLLNIAIAISMLMVFASWQIDRARENEKLAKKLLEQERKLNRQKQEIMMSQIQPHFIFNSLTAIAQLCEKQPKVARDATISFAEFLRAKINGLKNPEPITFSQELENIENYLMLEKIRFGDQLEVSYDIRIDSFYVPILSIQPLVENAVKHGIKQSGRIEIETCEKDYFYEVVVKDNGIGFDGVNYPKDDKTHVGVFNIKERLKDQMNATLTYEIPKEGGTIARVLIPKIK